MTMSQVLTELQFFASKHGLDCVRDEKEKMPQVSVYSSDRKYRYAFARSLGHGESVILWVLLNPGTGDSEERKRPTLARMVSWSESWGFGTLLVGNLFAARTKSARDLRKESQITGPLNDEALKFMAALSQRTIAAWGNSGIINDRSGEVRTSFSQSVCFGLTKRGEPKHPLYVPSSASLIEFAGRAPRRGGA